MQRRMVHPEMKKAPPDRIPDAVANSEPITIRELKEMIRNWPETDLRGDDTEVWIERPDGPSSPCVRVFPLNYRTRGGMESADILLGHDS